MSYYQELRDMLCGGDVQADAALPLAVAMLADAVEEAARTLGTNSADTGLGALELLAREVRDGLRAVAYHREVADRGRSRG